MKANLLLADFAQNTPDGKATAVGLGWTFTDPTNATFGVLVIIEVPWTATNQQHHAELRLVDGDGKPVTGPEDRPIEVKSGFEVGRPPGHPAGTPQNVPISLNVQGLRLAPNSRYEWVLYIDGHTADDWRVGFCTRPVPPVQLAS